MYEEKRSLMSFRETWNPVGIVSAYLSKAGEL